MTTHSVVATMAAAVLLGSCSNPVTSGSPLTFAPYTEDALAAARAAGQPVLIKTYASW